ncbi:MAG: ABC transporter substrate-binding protein [Saccharofermentanales bacterium]|jgi:hypothetical protein
MFINNIVNRLSNGKPEKQAQQKSKSNTCIKTILILSLLSVFLLSSCSVFTKKNKEETQTDQKIPETGTDNNVGIPESSAFTTKQYAESAVLRVFWQTRDDYNPLNTFDYSGRAVYQLMYRSLFKITKANLLTMDLARSASYIADKNLYHIELVPGITFSDGTLITAKHCVASILQYKTNLSKYFEVEESILQNSENEMENETESTETPQNESENNLAEILQKHPDLFPLNNNLLTQCSEDFIFSGTLSNELKLLNIIDEVKAIDEQTIEISLRDPDENISDDTAENNTENNSQTIENDEYIENADDNIYETDDEGNDETINNIDNAENSEDLEKKVYYKKDPGVLFALTMPIIPENSVSSTKLPTVTSADYSAEQQEQGSLLLSATDSSFSLQKIQLTPFSDIKSAMTALIDNKLDLIYLNEQNYNLFSKQNNANILSFPGQSYYYLSFGKGETISIPEIKNAIINVWNVRDDLTSSLTGDQSSNHLPLQYNDQAISVFNLFEQQSDSLDIQTVHEVNSREIKLKVLVPDNILERDWAFALREKMLGMNIKLEPEYVEPDVYQALLEKGDYDLAFNKIDLSYPMSILDTFVLINPSVMESLTTSELELSQEINDYFYSVERQIDPKILSEKNIAYRNFINQKYSELDILGIGFAPVGILLTKNIEGSSESHFAEPYSGLEDLWVWQ